MGCKDMGVRVKIRVSIYVFMYFNAEQLFESALTHICFYYAIMLSTYLFTLDLYLLDLQNPPPHSHHFIITM